MLCDLHKVLPNGAWLITVAVPMPVPIASIICFSGVFVLEVRSIQSRRESIGRLEIAHEMTLVIQSHLKRNLFHAQET